MVDDKQAAAAALRQRAARVRAAAEALSERVRASPPSPQEDLLRIQAAILNDGAAELEDQALIIEPAKGRA